MLKKTRTGCLAVALGLAIGASGAMAEDASNPGENVVMARAYAPVSATKVLQQFGGASGAEVKMAHPQAHKIQFLKGGVARVAIWDGRQYMPHVFTSVESHEGSRVCLASTRGWTGGCLTLTSNGQDFRCRFLWNNGSTGETACRVTPIREG
jgi:hypothetical protein